MFCASVAYPLRADGVFDFDYFTQKYIPTFVNFLGENCVRHEVRRSLETPGAPAPTYVCIANFWVKSGEAFGATLQAHGQEIYADIPNFTNTEPVRSWDQVLVWCESD